MHTATCYRWQRALEDSSMLDVRFDKTSQGMLWIYKTNANGGVAGFTSEAPTAWLGATNYLSVAAVAIATIMAF